MVCALFYSVDGSVSLFLLVVNVFHGLRAVLSADGSGLPTPPLVNGFHDGLHAIFLLGWQRISLSSGR